MVNSLKETKRELVKLAEKYYPSLIHVREQQALVNVRDLLETRNKGINDFIDVGSKEFRVFAALVKEVNELN